MRNKISISLSSAMVGRKFRDFYNTYLMYGESCIKTEMIRLGKTEPCNIHEAMYLEGSEIRKVTCVDFGFPVQVTVFFYR